MNSCGFQSHVRLLKMFFCFGCGSKMTAFYLKNPNIMYVFFLVYYSASFPWNLPVPKHFSKFCVFFLDNWMSWRESPRKRNWKMVDKTGVTLVIRFSLISCPLPKCQMRAYLSYILNRVYLIDGDIATGCKPERKCDLDSLLNRNFYIFDWIPTTTFSRGNCWSTREWNVIILRIKDVKLTK